MTDNQAILSHWYELWNSRQFPHAWLIQSDDIENSINDIENIITQIMNKFTQVSFENNPDIMIIKRLENSSNELAASITMEQMRGLHNFINKTSAISPYRFVIIEEADKLNNNAANSCLKILEEPPKNCFLFLVTVDASRILPTIKSRCRYQKFQQTVKEQLDTQILTDVMTKLYEADYLELNKIANMLALKKNLGLWLAFNNSVYDFLHRLFIRDRLLIKRYIPEHIAQNIDFNNYEQILHSSREIKHLIEMNKNSDLDKRHSFTLIIEELKCLINLPT